MKGRDAERNKYASLFLGHTVNSCMTVIWWWEIFGWRAM